MVDKSIKLEILPRAKVLQDKQVSRMKGVKKRGFLLFYRNY